MLKASEFMSWFCRYNKEDPCCNIAVQYKTHLLRPPPPAVLLEQRRMSMDQKCHGIQPWDAEATGQFFLTILESLIRLGRSRNVSVRRGGINSDCLHGKIATI